jgi:hypothetical protein
MENPRSTSLQKEVVRSARTMTTTTTGMQQIDEGNQEEEEILGMKTRNWRKICLSFAIELSGQDGDNIWATDPQEENNNSKIKHHPILSKLANFIVAVKKKCNTAKVMS